MADACCCYIINEGYLLPTLLSAQQARAAVSGDAADVIVFCIGTRNASSSLFETAFLQCGIQFHFVSSREIDDLPIMFARFFLHRLLSHHYKAVVYIDGDTQIAGSLEPLLKVDIDSRPFLAARDPMAIMLGNRSGRDAAHYLDSIGIGPELGKNYCNSGVIRFNLQNWGKVSETVMRVSAARDHSFKFPDQDPLNLAFSRDYLTMSYKWNFPSFFMGLGLQREIKPNILHFMSNPRPWDGPFEPWGRPAYEVYEKLTNQFPQLKPMRKRMNLLRRTKYRLQQRFKRIFESPQWRTPDVHKRIMEIEQQSFV